MEAAFRESPQQARQRGLSIYGSNHRKEARSFELLMRAFASSKYSDKYEIVRLSGASRADALFKMKGAGQRGFCIQLKAATSKCSRGDVYSFNHVLGYSGMLMVFVALDGGHIWAASGRQLSAKYMTMTIGSERDHKWRVSDIGSVLALCFHDVQEFPHMSIQEARQQCSPSHRVEAAAHEQLRLLFSCCSMCLAYPTEHQTTVDSVLDASYGNTVGLLRLQEKASHLSRRAYFVHMAKKGDALGSLPYDPDDFDVLAACVLHEERLQGLFLIPISVLVEQGFIGKKPKSLRLFPTWWPPKQNRTKKKYAWQLDFFLDLRTWPGSAELPGQLEQRLRRLISQVLHLTRQKKRVR